MQRKSITTMQKKKKHELNNNYIKHRPSSSIKEEQGHNKT
jgi:hypothetical protein